MTNAVPRNNVVLYWNEIKKWSREDRSNLAELIEVSLNEEDSTVDEVYSFVTIYFSILPTKK